MHYGRNWKWTSCTSTSKKEKFHCPKQDCFYKEALKAITGGIVSHTEVDFVKKKFPTQEYLVCVCRGIEHKTLTQAL